LVHLFEEKKGEKFYVNTCTRLRASVTRCDGALGKPQRASDGIWATRVTRKRKVTTISAMLSI
jgi:hypothetical protein